MAAPKGNKHREKYKTGKERREMCLKFMKHVEKGYSVDCFPECDFATIKRYMAKYPVEFESDQIAQSKRVGRRLLEGIGLTGTIGKIKGFNAKSWEFLMNNKYGWRNRQDITSDDKPIKSQVIVIGGKEIEF